MVGCVFHSIGGSSFTPSLHPAPQNLFFPWSPFRSHLVTHHCLTKRWQLLTNGLCCLLCISYPRRQWQALGSVEESKKSKGVMITHSLKAPGTGGWKSIQIWLLIDLDSTRAVKCVNPTSPEKNYEEKMGCYSTMPHWNYERKTKMGFVGWCTTFCYL